MACLETLCEAALRNFRDYLSIPTVHPDINYDECTQFLKKIADELGLQFQEFNFVPGKPILLMTWEGTSPDEPSILLNSHMDVAPVVESNWKHPPFGAEMDDDGNIYARGAQDMKCIPIMYLEAIRRFICKGIKLKRTLHLSFMPDEEIGGEDGMGTFVTTDEFKNLNIGFALDGTFVSPSELYPVIYAENICWQIKVHCSGETGHSALLQKDTAGEKLRNIIDKFMDYREKMIAEKECSTRSAADESITVVNLTKVSGGIKTNILPNELTATFDVRISIYEDLCEFEKMLNEWCCDADASLEFLRQEKERPKSSVNCSNPFWEALTTAAKKLDINLLPMISPGMTDIRYIRELDIPAFGFTPINKTPILFHGDDEYINKDKLLEGIQIYMEILTQIGNA